MTKMTISFISKSTAPYFVSPLQMLLLHPTK